MTKKGATEALRVCVSVNFYRQTVDWSALAAIFSNKKSSLEIF